MSTLRARCPDCRTLTAVAIGPDYQCHSCGREFAAGLVRVPRAWEGGGDETAAAARLDLPWPEAAVVEEPTPEAQAERLQRELPVRPLVVGGCAQAHVGAVRALACRHGRLSLVWLDARPEPPPLRLLVEAGDVGPEDVVRGLPAAEPPPGPLYVAVHGGIARSAGLGALLAALPRPAGAGFTGLGALLAALPRPAGAGFTGLVAAPTNVALLTRLGAALGL